MPIREIELFVEDDGHRQVIGALVRRLAETHHVGVRCEWRNARHGHGAVVRELEKYLRDLERQGGPAPDLIIAATDANCQGLNKRIEELRSAGSHTHIPLVFAVPDPHVERWLLLDGAAFKAAIGKGCNAPDRKCERDLYKQRLREAIDASEIMPLFGGIEFAEDIVRMMDLERVARRDKSFGRFVDDLRSVFQEWQR